MEKQEIISHSLITVQYRTIPDFTNFELISMPSLVSYVFNFTTFSCCYAVNLLESLEIQKPELGSREESQFILDGFLKIGSDCFHNKVWVMFQPLERWKFENTPGRSLQLSNIPLILYGIETITWSQKDFLFKETLTISESPIHRSSHRIFLSEYSQHCFPVIKYSLWCSSRTLLIPRQRHSDTDVFMVTMTATTIFWCLL